MGTLRHTCSDSRGARARRRAGRAGAARASAESSEPPPPPPPPSPPPPPLSSLPPPQLPPPSSPPQPPPPRRRDSPHRMPAAALRLAATRRSLAPRPAPPPSSPPPLSSSPPPLPPPSSPLRNRRHPVAAGTHLTAPRAGRCVAPRRDRARMPARACDAPTPPRLAAVGSCRRSRTWRQRWLLAWSGCWSVERRGSRAEVQLGAVQCSGHPACRAVILNNVV